MCRMTVPVKEGMARVPLITKSSQQLQLTAVTQNTSLGSVAGTKPGELYYKIALAKLLNLMIKVCPC